LEAIGVTNIIVAFCQKFTSMENSIFVCQIAQKSGDFWQSMFVLLFAQYCMNENAAEF